MSLVRSGGFRVGVVWLVSGSLVEFLVFIIGLRGFWF